MFPINYLKQRFYNNNKIPRELECSLKRIIRMNRFTQMNRTPQIVYQAQQEEQNAPSAGHEEKNKH